MSFLVETCPKCGAELQNIVIATFPPIPKQSLFETILIDGALPRKTFSMGHSREKRYYLEGRKIKCTRSGNRPTPS